MTLSVAPLVGALVMTVPVVPDAPTGRRLLEDELSQPIYSPHESIIDWVMRQISQLLSTLEQLQGTQSVAAWVAIGVAIAAVITLVIIVGPMRRRRRARDGAAVTTLEDVTVSATAWRTRAETAFANEQWSEALVAAFRAAVQDAVDRVVVEPWPGLTAREATQAIGRYVPALNAAGEEVAESFDAVAYGNAAATRSQASTALQYDTDVRGSKLRTSDASDDDGAEGGTRTTTSTPGVPRASLEVPR